MEPFRPNGLLKAYLFCFGFVVLGIEPGALYPRGPPPVLYYYYLRQGFTNLPGWPQTANPPASASCLPGITGVHHLDLTFHTIKFQLMNFGGPIQGISSNLG